MKKLLSKVVTFVDDKTAAVLVDQFRRDKKYHFKRQVRKKFLVDRTPGLKIGDLVFIESARPVSKKKRQTISLRKD